MARDFNTPSVLEELHDTEEELHRDEKRIKIAFVLGMVFILALITGTTYFIIQSVAANKSTQTIIKEIPVSVSITPTATQSAVLTTPSPAPIPITNTTNEASVKDYYINIGSGTNQSTDWADVNGAITTADLGQYQNVKEIHFEAFINVPTANGSVSVRLLNKTDGYAVWNSEITRDSTTNTYQFISPVLIYDKTPKLYQVQMKSQLNVVANLVSSRIHVIAK